MKTVDTRGLDCPQPVINAKKALDDSDVVLVIVDSTTALENVSRMARSTGCTISREDRGDGIYLTISKSPAWAEKVKTFDTTACADAPRTAAATLVFTGDTMGRGNDELGSVLIKSFIHTLTESGMPPETIILFNNGVKLAVEGSEVLDDLKILEAKGSKILVCGTCLKYFNLVETLSAGSISNMYEIQEKFLSPGKLIQI